MLKPDLGRAFSSRLFRSDAFTLIELLVVIAIIAILAEREDLQVGRVQSIGLRHVGTGNPEFRRRLGLQPWFRRQPVPRQRRGHRSSSQEGRGHYRVRRPRPLHQIRRLRSRTKIQQTRTPLVRA
ncbi:MAG: hypothetical protein DME21_10600 [Verrucomicrobia bacterium]|nr:MAG: hypothetical protein DME21_10600 [Verrucomicrobiota bacterium]